MVKVTVTLEYKHHAWYVVGCEIGESAKAFGFYALPARKFMSEAAATNYVKRMVLSCLKANKNDATGADITCCVEIRKPEERQSRA